MKFTRITKQKSGEVIEAKTLADTAEAAEWSTRIRAESPLEIISTAGGPLIRLAGPLFGVYIGTASGTITARSGSTPGSGTVAISTYDGSTLGTLGVTMPVLNYSGASGGIGDGTYVVVLRIMGKYWVISAECVA